MSTTQIQIGPDAAGNTKTYTLVGIPTSPGFATFEPSISRCFGAISPTALPPSTTVFGSIMPLNKPSLWGALPGYLANTSSALRWDPLWVMRNLDWVARFLANAMPSQTLPRAKALPNGTNKPTRAPNQSAVRGAM